MRSGGALGKARERVGYTVIAVQGRQEESAFGFCFWILLWGRKGSRLL